MRKHVSMYACAAFLLLFGLGGSAARIASAQTPAPTSPKYTAWLTKAVRHQLVMLPWYTVFDNLAYKVDGYNVTLYGQVTRPVLRDDAARAVKGLEGVGKVDNQIQVLPLSPMDWQIRRAEFRAIYSWPSLQLYALQAIPPIHIIVANGHVTLVGIVDNQTDRNVAALRANTVPDVFSVKNDLTVEKNSTGQGPKSGQ